MAANLSGFDSLLAYLEEVKSRMGNMQPALEKVAEELKATEQAAFDERTSPDGSPWEPRSLASEAIRGGRTTGNLRRSIRSEATPVKAIVSAAAEYAEIQNRGNPNNRLFGTGVVKPIPARPFSPIDESGNMPNELQEKIGTMLATYLLEGETEK